MRITCGTAPIFHTLTSWFHGWHFRDPPGSLMCTLGPMCKSQLKLLFQAQKSEGKWKVLWSFNAENGVQMICKGFSLTKMLFTHQNQALCCKVGIILLNISVNPNLSVSSQDAVSFPPTSRKWCQWTGGPASTVCDMSIPFGVTRVCGGRGLYGSASLSSVTRRGQAAGRAITPPPGVAPDRLETSGHIWEGSADGGVRMQWWSSHAAG